MNKKLWVLIVSLITIFVLSACNGMTAANTSIVEDKTCDTEYALKDVTGQRCVTTAELKIFNDAAASALGGTSQGSDPAVTPAPAAASGSNGTAMCSDVEDFSDYVGQMAELIAILDEQPGKVGQPLTNFTFEFDYDVLYWTTAAVKNRPAGLNPVIVDGTTGIYCIAGGTVLTVNFSGAYMAVAEFDPDVEVVADAGLNTGCMDTATLVAGIEENHADTDALIRWLNDNINDDNAPYLPARIRPNPLREATYSDLTPATVVFWMRAGMMAGKEGVDWVVLSQGSGMAVYLIATDKANAMWDHTAVVACDPINPEADFNFWQ